MEIEGSISDRGICRDCEIHDQTTWWRYIGYQLKINVVHTRHARTEWVLFCLEKPPSPVPLSLPYRALSLNGENCQESHPQSDTSP